jgi:prolyl oligopeptidase
MRLELALAAVVACGQPARPGTAPRPHPPSTIAPATAPAPDRAVARTQDVVDHDYGLDARDPYRWMEGLVNDERDAWMRAQGERAAAWLAKLPDRERLRARLRELGLGVGAVFGVQLAGDRLFYKQLPPGEQLARLVVRDRDGHDRVLVAPAALADSGTHVSLHAYSPSPDGTRVAYVLSTGGSELGTLHVMDVATGKDLPDALERVWGEDAAAWLPDGQRFYYQHVPAEGADPLGMQVTLLHQLGRAVDHDTIVLGRGDPAALPLAPGEWPGVWVPPGTNWALSFIGGAHSEQRIAVTGLADLERAAAQARWQPISGYSDGVETAVIHSDRVYMMTYRGAPNRQIISVPVAHPDLAAARIEIAEDPEVPLVGMWAARDAMYLLRRVNGRAQLLRWAWSGEPQPLALPLEGWIPDVATDLQRDGVVFQIETWLAPGTYFRYDPKTAKLANIGLASTTAADFSNIVVEEVETASRDGTTVPLTILHAKDLALDGSHPALVYGYGSYGASQSPGFNALRLAWLERGGVYAIAHVRGGGERGRRWQDDGSRDHKLNGVHDFIACGEYLVTHGYTSSSRLAAQGGSMGGLLVGRVLTERPDLFAAVNVAVGFVNPLRLLHAENGANQQAELGDPTTQSGYRALYAMDPYLHVTRAAYPAVIFTVGVHDHRVAPWMTAKMAARMQAASTSSRPILLRIDADAGHGVGSTRDQGFAERADVWSFFLASFAPR